jgi:hypothetical protein
METLTNFQFTWTNLFLTAFVLSALWFALQFLSGFLTKTTFLGGFQRSVTNGLRYTLLIYEPVALLILCCIFVLINPIFHGLIMGLIFLFSFTAVKNYAIGRTIQLDIFLSIGNRLSTQNLQGIISKTGRLGLHLKTNKGLQFIPYTQLYSNGFMVLSGKEIGGFYELKITPQNPDDKINYRLQLTDLLATAPYLDHKHKPEILLSGEFSEQLHVKILVKEESHLYDLISLMSEWGFLCKLSKK